MYRTDAANVAANKYKVMTPPRRGRPDIIIRLQMHWYSSRGRSERAQLRARLYQGIAAMPLTYRTQQLPVRHVQYMGMTATAACVACVVAMQQAFHLLIN